MKKLTAFVIAFLLAAGVMAGEMSSLRAEDQTPPQKTFTTARAAANAFKAAIIKQDMNALLDIFGHENEDLFVSVDPVTTRAEQREAAALAKQKMSLLTVTSRKVVIVLGKANWTLPIPIVRKHGRWYFDTAAGRTEILARRIGRNELAAIGTLTTFVRAQKEYAARLRSAGEPVAYASFVMSTPGQTDGLWWDEATAAKAGPSPLMQFARSEHEFLEGRQPGDPFHGYYFRILSGQGANALGGARSYVEDGRMTEGFAMIAWPADYGDTGIMTFIVGPDGKIFEKNLGEETQSVVNTISIYDPDKTWHQETSVPTAPAQHTAQPNAG